MTSGKPFEPVKGTLPRGTCHECGGWVPLRVGGELREHRRFDELDESKRVTCPASGQIPLAAEPKPAAPKQRRQRKLTDRRQNVGIGMMDLGDFRVDELIQQRAALLDQGTVEEYAERLLEGTEAPPVVAFGDPVNPAEGWWLADGFHRVAAARLARVNEVLVDRRLGTRRDALHYAMGANEGLRRTNADKRKSVGTALDDKLWSTMSDRDIARMCGVSNQFVSNLRAERANADSPPDVSTVDTVSDDSQASPVQAADSSPPAPAEEAERADLESDAGGDPGDPVAVAREAVSNLAPDQLREVLADRDPREVRAAVRTPRRANDAYYTPSVVAEFCVGCLGHIRRSAQILEPSVGGGAWARAVAATHVMDVDPAAPGLQMPPAEAIVGDFLTHDFGNERFDVIVGNPPYNEAEAHVRKALSLLERDGRLGFLLRRNFAGPARYELFQEFAPDREVVLAPRVSFTEDGGTDSQEYSFFVWKAGRTGDKPWFSRIMRWRRP